MPLGGAVNGDWPKMNLRANEVGSTPPNLVVMLYHVPVVPSNRQMPTVPALAMEPRTWPPVGPANRAWSLVATKMRFGSVGSTAILETARPFRGSGFTSDESVSRVQ